MILETHHKTVMFYGNVLRIPSRANWIAANADGRIKAFVEEPHASYCFWEADAGAIWSLDARMIFEGDSWNDTLVYCPSDQQWMFEVAVKLEQAHTLDVIGQLSSEAKDYVLNIITDAILYRAGRNGLQITWDSWIKHAVPNHLCDVSLTRTLEDKLFPEKKEPEYRIVEDYYGRDIVVPPHARWIAMRADGSTYVYETEPVLRPGCWRENINGEDNDVPVAWFPPEIADKHWQDSLMEIQL